MEPREEEKEEEEFLIIAGWGSGVRTVHKRVYPKVSGLSHNEIYAHPWYYTLRSNTKGYGGRTH
jgi:hypothetical protein